MKVLVVDDQQAIRVAVTSLLRMDGHECIEAENGQDAIQMFIDHRPDFVLMDLVMPVMDGYGASQKIKELSAGDFVPIIFLTGVTEQDSLIQCLEYGDDYLVKPINHVLLSAKITVHQRTMELTHQIQAKNNELTTLHERLQREHEMGRHVLTHAAERSWDDCPLVRSYLSSMSIFNGDLHLVAPNPKGGLYVFLGDMTGHGLSASIGAVPVSQVFFTMCAKARSVREIARELNTTLKEFLPDHMFCAAMILELNASSTIAKVWAGGLPPSLTLRPGTGIVDTHKSPYLPLGILDNAEFQDKTTLLRLEQGDLFLTMSDGVLEAESSTGDFFGDKRLNQAISTADEGYFERIVDQVAQFGEGTEQSDDISLVEIKFESMPEDIGVEIDAYKAPPWSMDFAFGLDEITQEPFVLVDHIFKLLPQEIGFVSARQTIQAVLVELYSNALEHGILELDSRMKKDANGFEAYYTLREERLAQLSEGSICISLDYSADRIGEEVTLVVRDSGGGFSMDLLSPSENDGPWGRGLGLVDSLCTSVSFNDKGNEVSVGIPIKSKIVES